MSRQLQSCVSVSRVTANEQLFKSSLIRQKGESQNGVSRKQRRKNKNAKLSEKRTPLIPWYAHVCVRIRGVRNIRFSEHLVYFVFLKHPFWDSPFCSITDELVSLICFTFPIKLLGIKFSVKERWIENKNRISAWKDTQWNLQKHWIRSLLCRFLMNLEQIS